MKVNDRVSWIETYRTAGNVIAQRTVWGNIIDIMEKPGDIDGFPIQGTYVRVIPMDGGGSVFVLSDHINLVQKA